MDPCENPDLRDEYGDYPDCNDDIYPPPPDDTSDDEDSLDTQLSTSNNIAEHTTVPPNSELSSANNVVQDPSTSTTSEDSQDSNNVGNSEANAESITQGNGNCNKAQYALLLLTSMVLKILLD